MEEVVTIVGALWVSFIVISLVLGCIFLMCRRRKPKYGMVIRDNRAEQRNVGQQTQASSTQTDSSPGAQRELSSPYPAPLQTPYTDFPQEQVIQKSDSVIEVHNPMSTIIS